jgi:hypothetical protein
MTVVPVMVVVMPVVVVTMAVVMTVMTAAVAVVTATVVTAAVRTCIGTGRDESRQAEDKRRGEGEEGSTFEHCRDLWV